MKQSILKFLGLTPAVLLCGPVLSQGVAKKPDILIIWGPLNTIAGKFLLSMKDYPPSATPGSFNLDNIQKKIEAGLAGK